ncbi:MAG: zinc transporter permease [Anaerophaga sp.]|uniref:metal ABC transporter permease n=1 Tax=Anaerophaga thermohalophila TaxID=177400 RepID=UPI000237C273|nr:metal ABC transporter permease [Anaerophaga thermohalophila]MBZ4675604.1 zinc transporter permease [Anaerophaga sp.]MDI3520103.1 zinc transport system permease protein [Anaerophaga sp.]MDK2841414.1 zinc transport system permease protein [Anaerophaga sp.]MDN5290161.1 zinc transport system permease protein [Anaerophaga sp.]
MENLLSLFEYQFFQNALLAAILTSLLAAMTGTYIVSRKIVFISGGITHASFGGIGMAYYFGVNPFLGAVVFAISTALGIEWIATKGKVREDSAIAILWSLGMALGIIFVFLTPGYTPNLMSFLFGSILSVGTADLWILSAVLIMTTGFFILFFRPIVYTAFDPEFSKTRGVPVALVRNIMAILIALAIVLSIRTMGIILVLSLFTIPQNTAFLFSGNFKPIIFGSAIFGVTGSLIGLLVASWLNIPGGAAIIFVLTLQFLLIKGIKLLVSQKK